VLSKTLYSSGWGRRLCEIMTVAAMVSPIARPDPRRTTADLLKGGRDRDALHRLPFRRTHRYRAVFHRLRDCRQRIFGDGDDRRKRHEADHETDGNSAPGLIESKLPTYGLMIVNPMNP